MSQLALRSAVLSIRHGQGVGAPAHDGVRPMPRLGHPSRASDFSGIEVPPAAVGRTPFFDGVASCVSDGTSTALVGMIRFFRSDYRRFLEVRARRL